MKRLFYTCIFLIGSLGCKHDPDIVLATEELYDIKFVFVNHDPNGFGEVNAINLESWAYKQNSDSTFISSTTYSDPEKFPNVGGPELSDSIVHRIVSNCSIGSKKAYLVQIKYFDWSTGSGHNYRTQVFSLDTVWTYCNEPNDFTEKFVWPDDTLRYVKTVDVYSE